MASEGELTFSMVIGAMLGGILGGAYGYGCSDSHWKRDMRTGKAPKIIEMLQAEDDLNAKRKALENE